MANPAAPDQRPEDEPLPLSDTFSDIRDFLLGDPLPKDDPGTATHWVQLAEWSDTEQGIVIAMVALILLVTAWNLRHVTGFWRRLVLFLMRAAIVVVLLFAFYQPALLEERRARSTNTIILLADDSASMTLPHKGAARRDLVAAFIRDHAELWKRLEETNVVESYRYADGLEPTDWRDMDKALIAAGEHTRVLETIDELRDLYRNRDVGGIILLGDGIDNGRAGRMLSGGNRLDRETRLLLESFEAPFHTFGLEASDIQDVSVHELRYSPFAFKRNQSTIEADIHVHGYGEGLLEVELLEEGKLVRSVTREIAPDVHTYTAAFDFTPVELGHHVYAVRVKAFPDEVTLENNERYAVIRVNRDKIRVLQIAGHPSWDVRFLRNHLKRTPNIQLISFFILINTGSPLRAIRPGETALIPFPAEELFVHELGGFDLVILQDFNYGPFSTPTHLHRIRDYVKGGGALLMVGGRLSLGAGDYAGTELAEVLPVDMTVPDFQEDALDTTEFRAALTEPGSTHTITQLSFDAAENERIWESFPPLEGLNKSRGLLNGGVALVDHPKLQMENGKGMPLIAVGEPEDGRVAVIATDSLWRWKMPAVGEGVDARHYDKLVTNLVRWLRRDPELDLVRVNPSSGVRALGESVDLEVRIFEPDYRPAVDHDFSMTITRRQRTGETSGPRVVHESKTLRTDEHGRRTITHTMDEPGIYDVSARSVIASRQLVAKTVFVVGDERPEMRDVIGTGRLLPALSAATGGNNYTLEDRRMPLVFRPPRVSDVTSRRYHERWNVPGVFFLACLLFALEWWVRRRWGLL